jgi:hypothetical protein
MELDALAAADAGAALAAAAAATGPCCVTKGERTRMALGYSPAAIECNPPERARLPSFLRVSASSKARDLISSASSWARDLISSSSRAEAE